MLTDDNPFLDDAQDLPPFDIGDIPPTNGYHSNGNGHVNGNGAANGTRQPEPEAPTLLDKANAITGNATTLREKAIAIAKQAGHLDVAEWSVLRDTLIEKAGLKHRDLERVYAELRKEAEKEAKAQAGAVKAAAKAQADAEKADKLEGSSRLNVAHTMIASWNGLALYDTAMYVWRQWNGSAWVSLNDDTMLQAARDACLSAKVDEKQITERFLNDVILLARLENNVRRHEWNTEPGAFFKNCRVSIPDLDVHDHVPDNYNTFYLPYDYDKNAGYELWEGHISRTIPDVLGRRALGEHMALSLIGDTRFHKAVVQIGPPRSGKSVTLEVARALLGDYAKETSAILFREDAEGGKRAARLKDARLVTIDELPQEALQDDNVFKRMAAHGKVEARGNWQDAYEFRWPAKFIFNTNARPRIYDKSGAVAARLLFIECPNSLLATPHLMDLNLSQKIIEGELPGVARWALMQLPDLLERSHYTESEAMQEINRQVVIESNPLNAFVDEQCVRGADKSVKKTDLWDRWRFWATESGYKPGGRNKFYGDMLVSGLVVEGRDPLGNNIFQGVGLTV